MLLDLRLGLYHGSALVKPAAGAHPVRHHKLGTVRTLDKVHRGQFLVSSAFVPPCTGHTFFRHRHGSSFSILTVSVRPPPRPASAFQTLADLGSSPELPSAAAITSSQRDVRCLKRIILQSCPLSGPALSTSSPRNRHPNRYTPWILSTRRTSDRGPGNLRGTRASWER